MTEHYRPVKMQVRLKKLPWTPSISTPYILLKTAMEKPFRNLDELLLKEMGPKKGSIFPEEPESPLPHLRLTL